MGFEEERRKHPNNGGTCFQGHHHMQQGLGHKQGFWALYLVQMQPQ